MKNINQPNRFRPTKLATLTIIGTFIGGANAAVISFTGGTFETNLGAFGTTDNTTSYQNIANYVEGGFKFEFTFAGAPSAFASIVGDYYNTGNDVVHWHWSDGPFGEVTEVTVSKVDGTNFDLGGFRVSTNTSNGGGLSTGGELVSINTSKANGIFNITPDNWGLGSGPDPLITIAAGNTLFDDISWFSFTNDPSSTAVGMGLDNFFIDEEGSPGGIDPTPTTSIPEPSGLLSLGGILALGLLLRTRR